MFWFFLWLKYLTQGQLICSCGCSPPWLTGWKSAVKPEMSNPNAASLRSFPKFEASNWHHLSGETKCNLPWLKPKIKRSRVLFKKPCSKKKKVKVYVITPLRSMYRILAYIDANENQQNIKLNRPNPWIPLGVSEWNSHQFQGYFAWQHSQVFRKPSFIWYSLGIVFPTNDCHSMRVQRESFGISRIVAIYLPSI